MYDRSHQQKNQDFRGGAIHFKFHTKLHRKFAIIGPFFTKYFVLAITFQPMQFFPIRFLRLSTFCQFFAETYIMTIFMAILRQAIMAKINKRAIMDILVWIDMTINMVNIAGQLYHPLEWAGGGWMD